MCRLRSYIRMTKAYKVADAYENVKCCCAAE